MNDKIFLEGKRMEVITIDEYRKNPSIYSLQDTAIHLGPYVLPVKTKQFNPNEIGYYVNEILYQYRLPVTPEEKEIYSDKHLYRFSNVTDMRDIIQLQGKINDEEMAFLSDSDNIYKPEIDVVHDSPIMIGLKQAIMEKEIDINRYSSRFSKTAFNNDKRLLSKHDISIKKFMELSDKFDMKATLIIEDKKTDCPNPIGHKIVIKLDGGNSDE